MRIHRKGMLAMLVAASLVVFAVGTVSAAGNTLRIEGASTTVAKDALFTIKIVQNASVATSGTQVTLTFDRAKLQVTKVTRGAPYATAPIFLGADGAAIGSANKSGKLQGVAAALFPPASVPTGDQEFLAIEMKAIACGSSKLGLPVSTADATILDGRAEPYGTPLKITTTGGSVTIACDGSAGAPAAPGASLAPGATPAPSGDVAAATGVPDPLASVDPLAPVESAPADGAVASPGAAAATPDTALVGVAVREGGNGNQWLDFALAALAVAAAALALLIIVMILVIVVAGLYGLAWLLRSTRQPTTEPPAPEPGAAATETGTDAGDEEPEYDPLADEAAAAGAPPEQPAVADEAAAAGAPQEKPAVADEAAAAGAPPAEPAVADPPPTTTQPAARSGRRAGR